MSVTTSAAPTKTRNRRAKMTQDMDAQSVTFTLFRPGTSELTDTTFVASLRELPSEIVTRLALDRLRNKLMDSYSDPTSDILEECGKVYDGLKAGMWSLQGESVERSSMFIEAAAELWKSDVERVRAKVNEIDGGDDADAKRKLAEWRKDARILDIVARIGLERARKRAADAAARAAQAGDGELEALV
jgi:hypothetical protein